MRGARSLRLASAVAVVLCASRCDVGGLGTGGPGPSVHDSHPADGERGVPRLGPLRVRFDERVIPRSVNRATVYITSGPVRPVMSVRYDLLTQSAILTPIDAARPLESGVDYVLVVDGVVDLDGVAQQEKWKVVFHTGDQLGAAPATPARVPYAVVAPIFAAHCAGSHCHGPGPVAVGLDLSSPAGLRTTAINVVARTLPAGTATTRAVAGVTGFVGMHVIDEPPGVGHPETSYLMYTVLGDSHVVGDPMPPPGDAGATPLSQAELSALSNWIATGAATEP